VRLLVLGGGGFLGYHAVTEALTAGHEVTVFSRSGQAPADGVEAIAGDRRADLSGLHGRAWDAVFDTFTDTEPGAPAVRATAELLSGAVGAYGYVSEMSVYAPSGPSRPDESGPVRRAGGAGHRPAAGTLAGQAGGRGGGDRAVRRSGAVPAGRHHGRAPVDPLHLLAGAHRRCGDGPVAAGDPIAG
jgi:2'-hydroxyisoflavone reductase